MFELIPFDRRGSRVSVYDPFRMFDEMERSFFNGNHHAAVSAFRTDVTDTGDAFVLDAELPGFKKVISRDYQRMIRTIGKYEEQGISREASELEAFKEITGSAV